MDSKDSRNRLASSVNRSERRSASTWAWPVPGGRR